MIRWFQILIAEGTCVRDAENFKVHPYTKISQEKKWAIFTPNPRFWAKFWQKITAFCNSFAN